MKRSCKTIGVVLGVIFAVGTILAFLHSIASDLHSLKADVSSITVSLKQIEVKIKGMRSDIKARRELSSVRTQSALDIVLRVSSCMHASM